jgi:hypothetical protein
MIGKEMATPQSIFWQAREPSRAVDGYLMRFWQKTIYLGGTVSTRDEAEELITAINALKDMLPDRIGFVAECGSRDRPLTPAKVDEASR